MEFFLLVIVVVDVGAFVPFFSLRTGNLFEIETIQKLCTRHTDNRGVKRIGTTQRHPTVYCKLYVAYKH